MRLSLSSGHLRPALVGLLALAMPLAAHAAPPAPESGVQAAAVPVAVEARLEADAGSARLSFTMSAPVTGRVSVLDKPDRIVIDLPEVNFQIASDAGRKAKGLVKSFRAGLIAPGRSRVVIELAGPALPAKVESEPVLSGAASAFVVELKKADRDAYARAVVRPEPEAPRAVAAPAAGDRRPVVVLDPGHGGIDTGAIGLNRTIEKDVVFAFARELRDKLERTGVRVVMTRDADSFVALGERVRIARAANANLFVSLHADTLRVSPEVNGLTVYTNAERASDAEAARLAEAENRADSAACVESQENLEEVAGILSDLTRRETRTYSHLFAKTLVGQITAASKLNKNPHRSAAFVVLRAPDVPSALVELGYLSSRSDVELLTQSAWRDKATDSIAAAINRFLAPRTAQQAQAGTPQAEAQP
jgi:N-acetylmuramoyl-L-alanine amidase